MRKKEINRFNDSLKFISDFQVLMTEKLAGILTDKEIKTLASGKLNRNIATINIDPDKPLLLTTKIDPETYLRVQETAKKVTGNYVKIDKLLLHLLTDFIHNHEKDSPQKVTLKHSRKGARFNALRKFQSKFSQYY